MWYLLIPSCNLGLLTSVYPNVKVVELRGSGVTNFPAKNINEPFKWGNMKTNTRQQMELNYLEKAASKALTVKQIWDDLVQNHNLKNAVISKIVFYFENIAAEGHNDFAMLEFVKHTPHKNIDQKRIVGSDSYPEWSLYKFIEVIKGMLPDVWKKFDKSSVLTLVSVNQNQRAMNDPEYLRMFKMSFMQMYQLIETDYAIADTQFQTKGWAKA